MPEIVTQPDIEALCQLDEQFATIAKVYGVPPNWKRNNDFVSLSRIILEQQVSLQSADAHFKKLNGYLEAFTPKAILELSDKEMRDCQISRQKASYLRALSTAVETGVLNFASMESMSEPEIRQKLTSVKGIGNWTTDIYLMFCLQKKDIFPLGDVAVLTTAKQLYPVKEKEDVAALSERWKPYRSLAAYFFWHRYLKSRNR